MKTSLKIEIPPSLKFSDLELARDPDGMVSFSEAVIEQICEYNQIDTDMFFNAPEDNASQLIVLWYGEHRLSGGEPDPVADDLIAETTAEDQLGGGISYPPGSA